MTLAAKCNTHVPTKPASNIYQILKLDGDRIDLMEISVIYTIEFNKREKLKIIKKIYVMVAKKKQ